MNEYVLVFRGFARRPSWCHVVVSDATNGDRHVLVGELDDNPGTTVTNAIEEVAHGIRRKIVKGKRNFDLYEYVPVGLPELKPTFYRIKWNGAPGRFAMPTWDVVDPSRVKWA